MKKRTKRGQKKHDEAILNSMKYYKRRGFQVEADLPGMKKPSTINGRIPDLVAKKGRQKVILEVETKNTIKKDKLQHQAFEKYSDNSKDTKFRIKEV